MGQVTAQPQLRLPFAASVAVHAALVVWLAFQVAPRLPAVPIGVDVQLIETPGTAPALVRADRRRKSRRPEAVAPANVPPVPQAPASTARAAQASATPAAPLDAAQSSLHAAPAGPAGQADGQVVSALERYKYELRLFLESRKVYPEAAKRLRQTGTVVVQFIVGTDGGIRAIDLEQASSSETLNRAALDLVRRAQRFKPLPVETKVSELKLSLPIQYRL